MRVANFILVFILICNLHTFSQKYKILTLNEGSYDYINQKVDVPVTLGEYDFTNKLYRKLDQIDGARFASDLVLSGNSIWVAADRFLVEYNRTNRERVRALEIEGIRKVALYDQFLIVTRGEYLKQLSSYVQIYRRNDLSLAYEIPYQKLPYTAENIVIQNDKAYISINNGFVFGEEVGKIIVIDLNIMQWINTIDLGDEGKNPENLVYHSNKLYTLNNRDFQSSSISEINLANFSKQTMVLSDVQSLCGTSALIGNAIIYQEYGETNVGQFELSSRQSGYYKELGKSFYGMTFDNIGKLLCAGITDFKTSGEVFVYDQNFNLLYRYSAGVAPGYFAFDYANPMREDEHFRIVPNPASSYLDILLEGNLNKVQIFDLNGRLLMERKSGHFYVGFLQPGMYTIKVVTDQFTKSKPFIID